MVLEAINLYSSEHIDDFGKKWSKYTDTVKTVFATGSSRENIQ